MRPSRIDPFTAPVEPCAEPGCLEMGVVYAPGHTAAWDDYVHATHPSTDNLRGHGITGLGRPGGHKPRPLNGSPTP